jgi:tRNA uridine 5-carboxymethylaminomethyl modification enzyme
MAGINAHQKIFSEDSIVLDRDNAYIGVLIDDLITKGVDEPYRMFTSRAEHRILLRQDNADERLTPIGFKIGLASKERMLKLDFKVKAIQGLEKIFTKLSISPDVINPLLESIGSKPINQKRKLIDILLRPEINILDIVNIVPELQKEVEKFEETKFDILESTEIKLKYGGYIEREKQLAEKLLRLDHVKISEEFNYDNLNSISTEARQKLKRIKPQTIGQASRIPGVSPSDINVLLVYLGR